MSDIFREVEEDVRRERFEKLWKAYGNYAIAALVLLFVGIGAWQLYERHEQQEREKASLAFAAAQRISNPQAAASAFADLTGTVPSGYERMAKLSQANAMYASNQRKEAIELYKQLANGSDEVSAVARLRAAWAQADSMTRGDLATWLEPLDQPGNAWRELAQEVLAYADYRALDLKGAAAKYEALAIQPGAPDALRARARAMASFLKNGGAVTFGSVPPDTVPAPPTAANAAAPAAPGQ